MAENSAVPSAVPDPPAAEEGSVRLNLIGAALVLGLLLSGGLVWQRHVASLPMAVRSWQQGMVSVSDTSSGAARLEISSLTPGVDDSHCATVRYTGDAGSSVRLYGANYAEPADGDVTLTITAGSGPSCASFGTATTVYRGTVADFAGTRTGYGSGLDAWQPAPRATARAYGFSYTLAEKAPVAARVDFVWEARPRDPR